PPDQPGGVGWRRPARSGRGLRGRRQVVPQPDPALQDGDPDGVARLRLVHRRRRLLPRHVRLRGDGQGAGQGLPGRAAPGQDGHGRGVTDEELGGAEMHSRISGLSDYFAETEEDAIRIGRDIVAHFNWRKQGYGPTRDPEDPVYDPDEILGVIPADLRVPFDMREIVARFADGSRF